MSAIMDFNFEMMCELAKHNPKRFADIRSELITNAINRFNNKELARTIQLNLDSERICSANKTTFHLTLVDSLTSLSNQLTKQAKNLKKYK
jgi:hypothetical protein